MALHALQTAAVLVGGGGRGERLVHLHEAAAIADGAQRSFKPIHTLLDNKYYMDWINENILRARCAGWAWACGRVAMWR